MRPIFLAFDFVKYLTCLTGYYPITRLTLDDTRLVILFILK